MQRAPVGPCSARRGHSGLLWRSGPSPPPPRFFPDRGHLGERRERPLAGGEGCDAGPLCSGRGTSHVASPCLRRKMEAWGSAPIHSEGGARMMRGTCQVPAGRRASTPPLRAPGPRAVLSPAPRTNTTPFASFGHTFNYKRRTWCLCPENVVFACLGPWGGPGLGLLPQPRGCPPALPGSAPAAPGRRVQ